jgi:hypothetical protein
MTQTDFLQAQLAQARAALEATQRLKAAAEAQRTAAVEQLKAIAAAILAPEWNDLKREHPEAADWPPEQLGAWIVETGTRKLNRLELSAGGDAEALLEACVQERDRWQKEALELRRETERLAGELGEARTRFQALEQEVWQLRDEASRLRLRVAELAVSTQVGLLEPAQVPEKLGPEAEAVDQTWLAAWRASPDYAQDAEALRVVGLHGYVLREPVAAKLGMVARTGTAARLFERLREQALIEERLGKVEVRGRAPNLLRLTDRGRAVYRLLFGQEPAEPEDERLLRRHKSEEQVMLALQARLVLEEAGADVDLFPEPLSLPGGGKFEVDLVAVLEDQRIYVELERASGRGQQRLDKWSRYAQATKSFYFFVPNRDALNRLMTELNFWAYRRAQDATGIVVHICQLSGGKEGELWHLIRPLVGSR